MAKNSGSTAKANKTSTMAGNTDTSKSGVGAAAVFNVAVFIVFIVGFLILRPKFARVYQPRSTVKSVSKRNRPRPLASGVFGWFKDLVSRPESLILRDAGLDGYFFLRYLRFVFLICIVGMIMLLPILLPVNATGGGGQSGFDLLTFSNVKNTDRYYAHAFLGWIFFGFILFSIYREMVYYVSVRQAVLTSPAYANRISSRSILIGSVPKDYLSENSMASLFDGVKHVFINRKYGDLTDKVNDRQKLASKLENAEVKLLKTAVKNRLKSEKNAAKQAPIEGDEINAYVPIKKRPSHRLKPVIGKKVDTINYAPEKIEELNSEIDDLQQSHKTFSPQNSAFIVFNTQENAEVAVQTLAHHRAFQMSPRYIGVRPDDVIWPNLRLLWWERLIRSLGAVVAISLLVIFWAIPVAFVGALSNIKSLQDKLPWLSFLNNLPGPLFGLVSSLLPTILLAVLMMLLPIFIRLMAKLSGCVSQTQIEYWTQNGYFAFQVVQVFLVTTLSSGATAVVTSIIDDPTSAMSLLAENLPKASSFYISYFMLQGFMACGGMLLQIVTVIVFYAMSKTLDSTPRQKWNRWNVLAGPGWGTVFPVYTNLAVIAITYSLIAPILLGFAALTFGLIYLAFLHNLMFIQLPTNGRGVFYARALYQTFTGLYLAEVCMLGLFVVAKSWGPIVIQAVFIGLTVFVQVHMQNAFEPLQNNLPRELMRGNANLSRYDSSNNSSTFQDRGSSEHNEKSLQKNVTSSTDPEHDIGLNNSNEPINDTREAAGNDATTATTNPNNDSKNSSGGGFGHKQVTGAASKQMGAITRYLKPHVFLTPERLQTQFLPSSFHDPTPDMTEEEESTAYNHPSVQATNPWVWFPRDPYGLSNTEVTNLRRHDVRASDEGTWFEINQEKKKSDIVTSRETNQVPIYVAEQDY